MPKKQWKPTTTDEKIVRKLQQTLKVPPLIARLLVQRDISNQQEAERFFQPELDHLHDPFLMKDMDKAVTRLSEAISRKEKILLYGDYDVDGTTSVALMYAFLKPLGVKLDYYIPDRYKEGYGISFQGIDYANANNIDLIIAMDCGIRAITETAQANDAGIDMIICDHHLPGKKLPDAHAIIDPKRPDCAYPYKELSGCGLAFKLAQAYSKEHDLSWENLEKLLDFVVISIASDIVPMTGENRVLAWYGLKKLNKTKRPGLKALIRKSQRQKPLSISDIVFGLGPRINAAGRLGDADQAVKLLLSTRDDVAEDYARVLDYRNKLRKEFDERITGEAKALFEEMSDWKERKSIVLYQPHWHKGVIGIVASRMVEEFHRPTIICTESEGFIVGSARSIRSFDMHKALESCSELLINFGGHKYAAGLRLYPNDFLAFQDRFEGYAFNSLEEKDLLSEIPFSAEIELGEITPKLIKLLKQFAPFGPGNRRPVFVSRGIILSGTSRVLKQKHLRLSIQQNDSEVFQAIAFGLGHHFNDLLEGRAFDICYTIEENIWKDQRNLQLMVKDIKYKMVGGSLRDGK